MIVIDDKVVISLFDRRKPLDAHVSDGRSRRANENDSFLGALFGKFHILRQETVSRMNGLSPGLQCGLEHFVLPQVVL